MNCDDVTGDWINVKNSTMRITQDANSGLLTGGYLTAVQANTGDAGNGFRPVFGVYYQKIVSFTVLYPTSVTSFIGNCYEVNGKDLIHTTWLLDMQTSDYSQDWETKIVGEDIFTRVNGTYKWGSNTQEPLTDNPSNNLSIACTCSISIYILMMKHARVL
uniref:Uncharacterized protein n=1 Tax=Acrobeloides nanus TaxID=290746 RepID=A0A914EJ87_9BILA